MRHFFTSESVTEGHPDKVCDQISDAVLDAILEKDPSAHVACECCATTGMVLVMGEITTSAYVPIESIVRQKVVEIGYDRAKYGFDGHSCAVLVTVDEQSPDIAMGVNRAVDMDQGAGDQGMMFGYACDETPEYMPLAIHLAHKVCRRLADVRKQGLVDYLRPDGKAQVTIEYEDDIPLRVDTVVLSTQHAPETAHDVIEQDMIEKVIKAVIPENLLDEHTKYFINPTGRFVVGGPMGDSGRLSWTPTAATPITAAAASPARIPARWTVPPPTPCATWPRIWWLRAWPGSAKWASPTPSAWPSP